MPKWRNFAKSGHAGRQRHRVTKVDKTLTDECFVIGGFPIRWCGNSSSSREQLCVDNYEHIDWEKKLNQLFAEIIFFERARHLFIVFVVCYYYKSSSSAINISLQSADFISMKSGHVLKSRNRDAPPGINFKKHKHQF